jgi:hypothetical protein
MKEGHPVGYSRIQEVLLTSAVFVAGGMALVHASPNCERFVHSYVTVPVRNRVSKATAEAWAKWRVAHPDWKPNPAVQRPKYIMTRKESVEKVEFACSMPTEPLNLDLLFTPADFNAPPPVFTLPTPLGASQITIPAPMLPAVAEAPIEIAQTVWPPLVPYVPPIVESGGNNSFPVLPVVTPPVILPTPEPPSFVLVALGLTTISLAVRARSRRAGVQGRRRES